MSQPDQFRPAAVPLGSFDSMRFFSIHQYFNKLHIAFLSLMMLPVLAFIVIYLTTDQQVPGTNPVYFAAIPLTALLDWVIGIVTFNKKIKSARNAQELGAKLEKYFNITIVRYSFVSGAGLILAFGFFLTNHELFGGFYLLNLLCSLLLWPTGPRVSRELRLRGDEREMVYFKKDTLS